MEKKLKLKSAITWQIYRYFVCVYICVWLCLKLCYCVCFLCHRPTLPDADAVETDSFDIPDAQPLMSRLQWEDSDISPTDSASSKASKEGTLI